MSLWALGIALLGVSLGLVAAVRDARPAQAFTNCETTGSAVNAAEQSLVDLVNAYRAQNGRPLVAVSPNLSRAAAFISEDMTAQGYFNHFEPSGRSPFQRAVDCGYASQNVGEVLAISGSPSGALALWKTSQGHNDIILKSDWKVVGVGQSGGYWALVFGKADDSAGSPATPSATSTFSIPTATPTAKPSPTPNPNGPSLTPIRRAMLQMVASE